MGRLSQCLLTVVLCLAFAGCSSPPIQPTPPAPPSPPAPVRTTMRFASPTQVRIEAVDTSDVR